MTLTARTKYDTVAMGLHWIIAAMMIFMLFFGGDLIKVKNGGGALLPSLHVSFGSAILILSVVRLAWRLINPPPVLPATVPGWEQAVSKAGHALFYALMIGLPLTGWLAFPAFAGRHAAMAGVQVFGAFAVPGAPSLGLPMGDIHNLLSNVGIAMLILHVLAALKHQFINRDDVLRRMLPL